MYTYDAVGSYERVGYSCQVRSRVSLLEIRLSACCLQLHATLETPQKAVSHAWVKPTLTVYRQPVLDGEAARVGFSEAKYLGGYYDLFRVPHPFYCACEQGSGKDLIQPVLDNQLKAASPLLLPAKVSSPYLLFLHPSLPHNQTRPHSPVSNFHPRLHITLLTTVPTCDSTLPPTSVGLDEQPAARGGG